MDELQIARCQTDGRTPPASHAARARDPYVIQIGTNRSGRARVVVPSESDVDAWIDHVGGLPLHRDIFGISVTVTENMQSLHELYHFGLCMK